MNAKRFCRECRKMKTGMMETEGFHCNTCHTVSNKETKNACRAVMQRQAKRGYRYTWHNYQLGLTKKATRIELGNELDVCISNVNALFNGRANSVKGWSITEANKRAGYNGL